MIDIKRLNQRIERIKARGITPITAKESETSTIAYAIERKGTSSEGLFLTFDEAKKKFAKMNPDDEELTFERYTNDITEFVDVISKGQTTVRGAVNYAYEKGMKTIMGSADFLDPKVFDYLMKLSKSKFIEALQKAGEYEAKEYNKADKYGSQQTVREFYDYIYKEYEKDKEQKAEERKERKSSVRQRGRR